MVENSKIEWTDHTFSPWTGCTKVSPGCDHCYAEGWSKRSGHVEWGPHGSRRRTSEANWRLPLKWNREAFGTHKRARVFCASLADVFDNHRSIRDQWRSELWHLIWETPHLDWLLLTKRPQNIAKMLPKDGLVHPSWGPGWPNVWLGTTVENQVEADRRIPHLLAVPAKVHFLSCEPLLGPVDLTRVGSLESVRAAMPDLAERLSAHMRPHKVSGIQIESLGSPWQATTYYQTPDHMGGFEVGSRYYGRLDWVICGGESGPGARPMHPDWARSLRDQCQAAGVAFHFKQWGEWAPLDKTEDRQGLLKPSTARAQWHDAAGLVTDTCGAEDPLAFFSESQVFRIGKKAAGRLLDGREWNEVPHA